MVLLLDHKARRGKPLVCACGSTINDGRHVCPLPVGIPCKGRIEQVTGEVTRPVKRERLDEPIKRLRLDEPVKRMRL